MLFRSLRAFREGKVYVLHPYNWYVTNLETAVADAYTAGKILCPDRFVDVDPADKAREVFRFFVGTQVYGQMAASYGPLGRAVEMPVGP